MIDIEIVLQNLAKKWKTDLLKSFRCPVMMLGYKAILCSDENTFGIPVKKYKMMKKYLQTSTTSTLLVTAVPAMTTTAASAGDYVTFSYLPRKSESNTEKFIENRNFSFAVERQMQATVVWPSLLGVISTLSTPSTR